MVTIESKETLYTYSLYHIVKAFFPDAEIVQRVNPKQESLVSIRLDEDSCFSVREEDMVSGWDAEDSRQERKKWVTGLVYQYLTRMTGRFQAWGMLTGVRPTKLAMEKIEKDMPPHEIVQYMVNEFGVSEKKADLAVGIAVREHALLKKLDCENGFSLYVGIPFCPSICSYCSFSSSVASVWENRMDEYVDALCREIQAIGEMTEGKVLNTIYIGGGTPTTLSARRLERVLQVIDDTFSMENVLEYTVEAGRPDSITKEKLETIRKYPVTRISVNPQTMQQKTLDVIGRKHTVEEVKESFKLARKLGFDNINMDLIAGLPGETAGDMRDTLRQIRRLKPDSLTVHTLAIKRAAKLNQEEHPVNLSKEITRMVSDSEKAAAALGLAPYYLYRQKNMAGNFENVGYAKVDKAGIYNILIMEEKQTILAAGAGATSKFVLPEKVVRDNGKETTLIRVENVKSIAEYISRVEEMIDRKGEILWR